MNSKREEYIHALSLLEITPGDDNMSFSVNVSEEFMEWFKRDQKLKRWSDSRFQKWFKGFMSEAMREVVGEQNQSPQQFINPFDTPPEAP
tara:strand:+ start:1170 stop:1439 length:270 start_codon:yes stop_codon:yes gene_type:complete